MFYFLENWDFRDSIDEGASIDDLSCPDIDEWDRNETFDAASDYERVSYPWVKFFHHHVSAKSVSVCL